MEGPFRYDPIRDRYRDARGRYVTRRAVRDALDSRLDAGQLNARTLTESLRRREIAIAEWQLGMGRLVRTSHLQAAAAARGGWAQMSAAEYGAVGARVRDQYKYLRNFAAQLEAGLPRDGMIVTRALQYVASARGAYHQIERTQMLTRGFAEEVNRLSQAEHCEGDNSCVEQTERGWVPIGALVAIGERICRKFCRCYLVYRNPATGEIAA